ncbi:MAG: DUF692 family protein [Deltaproteobacteria bacterium]|nr:DUF692 family protein [Deltaproteobacteria bacterium]
MREDNGPQNPAPARRGPPLLRPRLAVAVSHLFFEPSALGREALAAGDGLELKGVPAPSWISKRRVKVFHSGLGLAEEEFRASFTQIGRFLASGDVELFSCDLGPSARRRLGLVPLSPVLTKEEIFERSEKAVDLVRQFYQGPIAAENYNFYPTGLYEHVCRPDFIAEYLEKLDLSLTLDLAHAAITAYNFGQSLESYLHELPLHRVAEIHISRPYLPEGPPALAADAHYGVGPKELGWLNDFLDRLERVDPAKRSDGLSSSARPGGVLALRLRPWVVVENYASIQSVLRANAKVALLLAKRLSPDH